MSERKAVHSDDAPAALGPYSQAIDTGDLVFCSGQVPIDPATGQLIDQPVVSQLGRSSALGGPFVRRGVVVERRRKRVVLAHREERILRVELRGVGRERHEHNRAPHY